MPRSICTPMEDNYKVLVVGTTSDYIDWIRQANPERAIFLTDPEVRYRAHEFNPQPEEEIISCLDDVEQVKKLLMAHLSHWRLSVDGIACFDCESMDLAAILAKELSLPYPSVECIRLCRDKYVTKTIWQEKSVRCPQSQIVQSADGVFEFLQEIDAPGVLKPLTGSGSELVFHCSSRKDCDRGVRLIQEGLEVRKSHRMYNSYSNWFLVEECIHGTEYSCDFHIRHDTVEIIRLTKKIKLNNKPFGTIDGYGLTKADNEGINKDHLNQILLQGAMALGIANAVCMVDFYLRGDEIVLLEMTPRPGGDCIPFLLRCSLPLDILTYTLDFAQQRETHVPEGHNGQYAALRVHAGKAGTIKSIDSQLLQQDPRVVEVHSIRKPGHRIMMPPHDYESWYIGHTIFKPQQGVELDVQTRELREMYMVEIENDCG